MPTNILDEARAFLVDSLKWKQNHSESRHPWRRDWDFAVLHSLRVESYVLKILAREKEPVPEKELILIRLAAILHDISRLEKRENHAETGAGIAETWLLRNSGHSLESRDIAKIVEMIADHSNKSVPEQDFCRAVLKDADTLDEIGVMSVFMAANWLDAHSAFFFTDLRQRLVDIEIPFCDEKLSILNTRGAREILEEKKAFLENFIAQLTDEVEMEPEIEQTIRGISKRGNQPDC